ncbi:MAG: hypothetical protein HW402_219 [Dehalococcoidales bacterium]|nr:hypothetical protein [Dehalococcoidales bacterium]
MAFLNNLTLGKKITLLTALGLLLGIGVFSSLGMRAVNQATEAMLQDRLTTAGLVADYIDGALGSAITELANTAQSIEGASPGNDLKALVNTLETTYSRMSIRTVGIYLLNHEGQLIWEKAGSPQIDGIDLMDYPTISQAIQKGKTGISGLVSLHGTSVPVVLLVSPTKDNGSKGVLVASIDLELSSIGGFVQPIKLGQTGYVEIVDQNGLVVARTEPGPKLSPFEKSDHSGRFAALIAAGKPTRGVCHTCHESAQEVAQKVERKDVLAFVPLSEANWGVVIRQSETEALAPANELRRNLLFFGVGLVTVALLFVVVTTRDVGSRIRLLTTSSQRIAEGDLVSTVPVLGKDEVGLLAQALNEMRLKLKTSYDDLEQRTRELASLLSVAEILTSAFALPDQLKAVLAKAVEIIPGADGGALLLQGVNQDGLFIEFSGGLEREAFSPILSPVTGDAVSGEINKPADKEHNDSVAGVVAGFLQSEVWRSRVQSYIYADISHQNQNAGSIIIASFREGQVFFPSDNRLLQAIADYITIAIERAQLTKEAEKARALSETDRLRSQFISSVSHELRSPLTLIKGYSTSLLRQDVSWDKQTEREFLQIIDERTDELRDLIDKLLQSAKLEAGALKLEKEPVLMPQLARRVVEDAELRAKKHQLTLRFPSSFPVVEADLRCMEQVLRNLVQNAIKYSREGGEIIIAGEVKEDKIIVSVSDEGIGIPPEHQDRVFERFYRVDNPVTRGTPGSGLGLSIAKGHVEAHGGKIWLESAPGKGSRFYFSLPLEREEGE